MDSSPLLPWVSHIARTTPPDFCPLFILFSSGLWSMTPFPGLELFHLDWGQKIEDIWGGGKYNFKGLLFLLLFFFITNKIKFHLQPVHSPFSIIVNFLGATSILSNPCYIYLTARLEGWSGTLILQCSLVLWLTRDRAKLRDEKIASQLDERWGWRTMKKKRRKKRWITRRLNELGIEFALLPIYLISSNKCTAKAIEMHGNKERPGD